MAFPAAEQLSVLLTPLVQDAGLELDEVTVSAAGRRSVVKVVLDSADVLDLDAVARTTRTISGALDVEPGIGDAAYTLEVTTPGTSRPLTLPRHWERGRGRRVNVRLADEEFVARIGAVVDGEIVLVLPASSRRGAEPVLRRVALTDVVHAAVEVEFAAPDPRELALTGAAEAGSTDTDTTHREAQE